MDLRWLKKLDGSSVLQYSEQMSPNEGNWVDIPTFVQGSSPNNSSQTIPSLKKYLIEFYCTKKGYMKGRVVNVCVPLGLYKTEWHATGIEDIISRIKCEYIAITITELKDNIKDITAKETFDKGYDVDNDNKTSKETVAKECNTEKRIKIGDVHEKDRIYPEGTKFMFDTSTNQYVISALISEPNPIKPSTPTLEEHSGDICGGNVKYLGFTHMIGNIFTNGKIKILLHKVGNGNHSLKYKGCWMGTFNTYRELEKNYKILLK